MATHRLKIQEQYAVAVRRPVETGWPRREGRGRHHGQRGGELQRGPRARAARREARALCKRFGPKWRRARIRALKRSRRNVETLKREGRCR